MGILSSIKRAVTRTVAKVMSGVNDKPKAPKPQAQMGPAGAGQEAARTAMPKRRRGARGRDSTIITAGSTIGTRTLLG